MKKYKPYLNRVDLVKNQVEREELREQEAKRKRSRSIQEQNRQRWLKYQEQLRSELSARYFHAVQSTGGESFSNKFSVAFDGSNDAVDLGAIKPAGAMTISYWFKGKGSNSNITTLGTMGGSGQRGYMLGVNNLNLFMFAVASTSTTIKVVQHTLTIDDTKWYHIAGVYNPSTYLRLFIDGSQVAEATFSVPSSQYVGNSNSTKIGNRGDGGSFGRFEGNIDEVAFFDSALTNDNISTIYTGGPNDISDLSPLSWYRMGDGDTFPTLTDNGSGGNNGTMTNMDSADIEEDVPE